MIQRVNGFAVRAGWVAAALFVAFGLGSAASAQQPFVDKFVLSALPAPTSSPAPSTRPSAAGIRRSKAAVRWALMAAG